MLLLVAVCLMVFLMFKLKSMYNEHYSNQPDVSIQKRILHLVLYSETSDEYKQMHQVSSKFYKRFPNVTTYYFCYSDRVSAITFKDDIMYIPGKESYMPGVLSKTIDAIQYFIETPFDLIVRSNISTIINFDVLSSKCTQLDYGGRMLTLTWLDPPYGIHDHTYNGLNYIQGTSIIVSKKFARDIVTNKKYLLDLGIIDDVSFGILYKQLYGGKTPQHFEPQLFENGPIDSNTITTQIKKDVFIFRHRNVDRKQDVENMKVTCKALS